MPTTNEKKELMQLISKVASVRHSYLKTCPDFDCPCTNKFNKIDMHLAAMKKTKTRQKSS